jgi:cyclic beta-1,2-glucan synthetase
MLNPIRHAMTLDDIQQYRVEPYVVVGDIYSESPHVGRGGWTWYTGSAGWLYRAGIEWLLGVRVQGKRLVVNPCIPSGWPGFSLALRYRSARYDIVVENPRGVCRGLAMLELDGLVFDDRTSIPLADDQRSHRVRAVLGEKEP